MDIKLNFGKYKGRSLKKVFAEDPGYVEWMYNNLEKGSYWQKQAAWLVEGTGEKLRADFVKKGRAGAILDSQFRKALQTND